MADGRRSIWYREEMWLAQAMTSWHIERYDNSAISIAENSVWRHEVIKRAFHGIARDVYVRGKRGGK